MDKHAKVTVMLNVPPGESCLYFDENGNRRACCSWILGHTGSGQRWCRIFNDAKIDGMMKCAECRKAVVSA
jgi:hypothetical protein